MIQVMARTFYGVIHSKGEKNCVYQAGPVCLGTNYVFWLSHVLPIWMQVFIAISCRKLMRKSYIAASLKKQLKILKYTLKIISDFWLTIR